MNCARWGIRIDCICTRKQIYQRIGPMFSGIILMVRQSHYTLCETTLTCCTGIIGMCVFHLIYDLFYLIRHDQGCTSDLRHRGYDLFPLISRAFIPTPTSPSDWLFASLPRHQATPANADDKLPDAVLSRHPARAGRVQR